MKKEILFHNTFIYKALRLFDILVDLILKVFMWFSAAGILFCLFSICYSVLMRYVFNTPPLWVDDSVGFTLVAIVMCSAGDALKKGKHVCVDIFIDGLTSKKKKIATFWGVFSVLVFSLALLFDGIKTVLFSKMLSMVTPGEVEVPVYILQMLIPFGASLIVLACLSTFSRMIIGLEVQQANGGH